MKYISLQVECFSKKKANSIITRDLITSETYYSVELSKALDKYAPSPVPFIWLTKTLINDAYKRVSVIDISDNQWISNRKNLSIKISDNESGVKNYRGTINDKWILLEYNPMKGILSYDFNDNVNKDDAKNVLEIKIEDNVGNEKKLIKTFYRKIK